MEISEDKPKRILFISQKEIQNPSFKEKYKDKSLFIYFLQNNKYIR